MSVDYRLFLRDRPDLAALCATDDDEVSWWANELARRPNGTWTFGAMTLSIESYAPRDGDALSGHPARPEIRWVIEAGGRHGDLFDEWEALVAAVCTRWRGGYYGPRGTSRWYSEVRAPVAPVAPDFVIADPVSPAQLAALIERALAEPPVMASLERRVKGDPAFARDFFPLLVARARTGMVMEPWRWTFSTNGYETLELADPEVRRELATLGPLARQISLWWEFREESKRLEAARIARNAAEAAAREQLYRDLIERRRRGGEIYGLPDDILELARRDRAAAVEAYARRYGVSLEQARQAVDRNVN